MLERIDVATVVRNFGVYLVGIALAVVGALGLAEAIELDRLVAGVLLVAGLAAVLAVHEYLDGPI